MKVALVEISLWGSLSLRTVTSYALKEENIKNNFSFTLLENTNFIEDLNNLKPDIICMSIWLWNYKEVEELSKRIKESLPNIPIILGGLGILYPEKFLENNRQFDLYCYEKQGEEVFVDILNYFLGNKQISEIEGIFYWKNNALIKTTPSTKLIKIENLYGVFETFPSTTELFTCYEISRGCKNNCGYCIWGPKNKITRKNPDKVIEEINNLPEDTKLYITDANTFLSEYTYILKNIKKSIRLYTYVDCTNCTNSQNEEFFNLFKDFKKVILYAGVQSFNSTVLKYLNRSLNFDALNFWETKSKENRQNMFFQISLIAGLPYQTFEILKQDIAMARKFKYYDVFPLIIFPGTIFWDTYKNWEGVEVNTEFPFNIIKTNLISKEEFQQIKENYYISEAMVTGGPIFLPFF